MKKIARCRPAAAGKKGLTSTVIVELKELILAKTLSRYFPSIQCEPIQEQNTEISMGEGGCIILNLYWVRLKGSYVVARIFFLLLLNCSAWPYLGPA